MDHTNLIQTLGQVSAGKEGQVFRDHLRGTFRVLIAQIRNGISIDQMLLN